MNIFISIPYEFKIFPDFKFMHGIAHDTIKDMFSPLTAKHWKPSYFSMIMHISNLISRQITST